jgi:uncharacterized Zn finger protein
MTPFLLNALHEGMHPGMRRFAQLYILTAVHSYSMYIEKRCPACGEEDDQEILSESHDLLVRCTRCGNVWHTVKEKIPSPVFVKAVVSRDQTSRICQIEFFPADIVSVGDKLVAECGEEITGVQVSSIESGPRRVEKAAAKEITTLWTREIEEVTVRISLHDGRKTIPLMLMSRGEDPFIIGDTFQVSGRKIRISHIKLRDGAVLRKEGWKTVASRIKRIYGYPARAP